MSRSLAALVMIALVVTSPLVAQQQGTPVANTQAPSAARLATLVDSAVTADLLSAGVPSVSIVVTRGDQVLLERAWGKADVASGRAADALRDVLSALNFRNLDDEPAFKGRNTTTEFLAFVIHERIAAKIAAGELGPHALRLTSLRVTLHESHVAWAAYEGKLGR